LDSDVLTPPDGIIDIEGPYYDRLFALTVSHLHMSKRLRPDDFSAAQVIRVAGPDEVALWVKKAHGGLYVGTTKDIYRLDGSGAELPDGTLEFNFQPVNIDNPPYSGAVANEGSLLVYIAADGWRAFNGAGSIQLSGLTSLLYQGRDRHGVSAVNIEGGRFRAAIAKGQLVAIMPEGDDTTHSKILYRYVFKDTRWYRHVYDRRWRSIHREQDGTLIAGDTDGFVWTLDVGNSDDSERIPVEIRTTREDDQLPLSPKEAANLALNIDTAGAHVVTEVYADENEDIAIRVVGSSLTLEPVHFDLSSISPWRQLQLRITGAFNRFRLGEYVLNYKSLPAGVRVWDSGVMSLGSQDLVWVRRARLMVRAEADLVVTPFFDGVEFATATIDVSGSEGVTTLLEVPIGRGFFGRTPRFLIQSEETFYPYWVEFQIRQTQDGEEKPLVKIPSGLGGEVL